MINTIKTFIGALIPHYTTENVAVVIFEDGTCEVICRECDLNDHEINSLICPSRGLSWLFWTYNPKLLTADEDWDNALKFNKEHYYDNN